MNFALLSAMAAERLSNGDNQLIEDMSRKVRTRSAMRMEKELKAGGWCPNSNEKHGKNIGNKLQMDIEFNKIQHTYAHL